VSTRIVHEELEEELLGRKLLRAQHSNGSASGNARERDRA
jgi:hypothetical protein